MKLVRGTVVSGKGEARAFTQLPWLREQFRAKFGFEPFPGTLNLRVERQNWTDELHNLPWVAIPVGEAGYCAAKAVPVEVEGRIPAVWILPEVPDYPTDQIELMSNQPLRAALGLEDGDGVTIRIRDGEA